MQNVIEEIGTLTQDLFMSANGFFSGVLSKSSDTIIKAGNLLKGNNNIIYKTNAQITISNYTFTNDYDYLVADTVTSTIFIVNIKSYNYQTWFNYIPLYNRIYGVIDARILYFDHIGVFGWQGIINIACVNAMLNNVCWNKTVFSKFKLAQDDKEWVSSSGDRYYPSRLVLPSKTIILPLTLVSEYFATRPIAQTTVPITHMTNFTNIDGVQYINFVRGFHNGEIFTVHEEFSHFKNLSAMVRTPENAFTIYFNFDGFMAFTTNALCTLNSRQVVWFCRDAAANSVIDFLPYNVSTVGDT